MWTKVPHELTSELDKDEKETQSQHGASMEPASTSLLSMMWTQRNQLPPALSHVFLLG